MENNTEEPKDATLAIQMPMKGIAQKLSEKGHSFAIHGLIPGTNEFRITVDGKPASMEKITQLLL